jgi:hypothetical protein
MNQSCRTGGVISYLSMKRILAYSILPLIAVSATVSGQIIGPVTVLNPSFESSTAGTGSGALFDTVINNWFMENHTGGGLAPDLVEAAQRRNAANMPVVPDGSQWANLVHSGSVTAGIYQAIDTFVVNWDYAFSNFTVSQRSNQPFVGVTVALYAGNVTGANATNLGTLGATLLDSFTITQAVFSAAGVAENYVVPNFTLNTGGNTLLAGQDLWVRISTTGVGHHLVDNVNVTAIPEPSTYAAMLGLLAFGVVVWRRRRSN